MNLSNLPHQQAVVDITPFDKSYFKWSSYNLRKVRGGTPSDVTVLYCHMGETADKSDRIMNYKNHLRGRLGGTNAVFADSSVRWVPGTQIGWP